MGGVGASPGAWPHGSEALCTLLNTLTRRAQSRATCARDSAREPAGWGTEERSILPGPRLPFVLAPQALRCPLALSLVSVSEGLKSLHLPIGKGLLPSPVGKKILRGPHLSNPGSRGTEKFSRWWRTSCGPGSWSWRAQPQVAAEGCVSARVWNVHLSLRLSALALPRRPQLVLGPETLRPLFASKHAPFKFNAIPHVC